MVNQLASDINDAEEAELRRMEGGAPPPGEQEGQQGQRRQEWQDDIDWGEEGGEGGGAGGRASASTHQPPPPAKRPRTAPPQATADELFVELVSWDPVGMPAGGEKAEVIGSMLTNFATCLADNAALLRQLHGRAQQAQI